MTKIVYDHQIFWWQRYGGISRYIYELATRVAEMDDFEVSIEALAYVNEYLKQCKPGLVVGFPVPKSSRLQIQKMVGRFNDNLAKIRLKSNPPDIVHETYYHGEKLSHKKTKVVVTVYDMIHEKFTQLLSRDMFQKLDPTAQLKQEAVRRADRIICISENTKKDLIELLEVDPNKISVVYLGTSLKLTENYQPEPRKYPPYILYVGDRISKYKNFQGLLQAYGNSSQLKNNFNLVLFGGGSLSREEITLIQNLGLPEGKVLQVAGDDADLANLYREASVFVYPSLYEGFGIPLLEAMSLNCPIACSNTSSLPEVAGNAAEFFDPYQPESIAAALEKVLFSTEKAENLVKLGAERITNFSWEACAEQTRQVYLSLL